MTLSKLEVFYVFFTTDKDKLNTFPMENYVLLAEIDESMKLLQFKK